MRFAHGRDSAEVFRAALGGSLAALLSELCGHMSDVFGETLGAPQGLRNDGTGLLDGGGGYCRVQGLADLDKLCLVLLGDVHAPRLIGADIKLQAAC